MSQRGEAILKDKLTCGIIPVLATPFCKDGTVDYPSLEREICFEVEAGCKALAIFGFASEFYKLGDNEKEAMIKVAIPVCKNNDVSLISSISNQSTEQAIMTSRTYEKMGVDALMILPPYTVPSSSAGIKRHLYEIAGSVKLPIIIQYAPKDTNTNLGIDDISEICERSENIIGIKLDGPNVGKLVNEIVRKMHNRINVMIGYAGLQMTEALSLGAKGIMPGASLADIYMGIYDDYSAGRLEQAIIDHERLLPFLKGIFISIESIIKWEKRILFKRGIISTEYCRYPCFEPDNTETESFELSYARIVEHFSQRGVFIKAKQV